MPAFAVLRIQKLKSWGDIAGAGKHNQRERDTPNADAARTGQNRLLVGDAAANSVDTIKEAIGGQRIRSNAVLGVELLLSASPEYFRPSAPQQAGTYDTDRLEAWSQATTKWLNEQYGSRVIKATLHLDEATPHIHALLVPLDDKGKLNCRALFGGTRHTLSALQTNYAQAVAPLGIGRGIANSRAQHQKVSQYYTLTQGQAIPPMPEPQTYAPLVMPNKVVRMSDERMMQYEREAATKGATAQREALRPAMEALKNENTLLRHRFAQIQKANARLDAERKDLRRELDKVRALDIGSVLSQIFKAKGPYKAKDSEEPYYILPDKREVLTQGNRWKIADAQRGKGAIDLVMTLRGYGQESLDNAVGELARHFGEEKATADYAAAVIENAAEAVRSAARDFMPEKERSQTRGGITR